MRLGAYEILSTLGEGGMGAVYRARDTKLGRDVAIKVLLPEVANDPERLSRFQREAQVLAALNHPHIAQIYGLEEQEPAGPFLVLELVEGPTLADRIAQGPLPLDDALPIARQIADALEDAHERGIIHRDLKPANIKVRPDGTVKVLDFGLAKALESASSTPGGAGALSNSPTLTSPALVTGAGVLLGTAAYMSPEQARGRPVDKRSDIWSFGVVLFEMLTGRRLFGEPDTLSQVVADVLRAPIDLSPMPSDTPPRIRLLVERCLDRDVKTRLRDIGEARVEIDRAKQPMLVSAHSTDSRGTARRLSIGVAALAVIGGVAVAALLWGKPRAAAGSFMRFADNVRAPIVLASANGPAVAISPDGLRLAFVTGPETRTGGATQLAWRALASAVATTLPGTDGASAPFFSPDGRWIAFFAERKLKKISIDGGAAVTVCDTDPFPRGGSWGEDGNILFSAQRTPLLRVSALGGIPKPATTLGDEVSNRFAQMLPGGQAFLFTASRDNNVWEGATIAVQTVATGERRTLVEDGYFARFVADTDGAGFLLYMKRGTLFAAPMDPRRLELTGPAMPVADDVAALAQNGFAHLDVARNGTVIYVAGADQRVEQALATFDPSGKLELLRAPHGAYSGSARPSPDGSRIAVRVAEDGNTDLAVYELATNRSTRLNVAASVINDPPVWTPDASHIVFSLASGEFAGPGLYWVPSDGSREPRQLLAAVNAIPYSFAPDGSRLAYYSVDPGTQAWSIWTLPIDVRDPQHPVPGSPELLVRSKSRLSNPAFSPDGRWIAYASEETRPPQVFVRPFSSTGNRVTGRWQISTNGGQSITWVRGRPQLIYSAPRSTAQVVRYRVEGDSFIAGQPEPWGSGYPQLLFAGPPQATSDGSRFVVIVTASGSGARMVAPTHVTFLLGFGEELRRRLTAAP
jgi:Tol biopolymer transport system component